MEKTSPTEPIPEPTWAENVLVDLEDLLRRQYPQQLPTAFVVLPAPELYRVLGMAHLERRGRHATKG